MRILTEDKTAYTDGVISIDGEYNMRIKTDKPFKSPLLIEAYYPASNVECSFMINPNYLYTEF